MCNVAVYNKYAFAIAFGFCCPSYYCALIHPILGRNSGFEAVSHPISIHLKKDGHSIVVTDINVSGCSEK